MAVNINKVYETVLYVLNKEQRGYIPPTEFNSLAELVQNEIFQSYLPDGNQLNRQNQNNTQNSTEFFNIYENNRYKLAPFEREVSFDYDASSACWYPNLTQGAIRLLGVIISEYNSSTNNQGVVVQPSLNPIIRSITELTSKVDYETLIRSKLTAPTQKNPIAYQYILPSNNTVNISSVVLKINPTPDSLSVNCLLQPSTPSWGFQTGTLGQYLYTPNLSSNFQLDISEEYNLIVGILKYAGVIINDPTVIEVAASEAQQVQVNEKS
jgi:hypothetical protein